MGAEKYAVCVFTQTSSKRIKGSVEIRERGEMVAFKIKLKGIKKGLHGFHVHESGDLRQGCKGTCSHYNPYGTTHGGLDEGGPRHLGDLGNIQGAGVSRWTTATVKARKQRLFSIKHLVGRALVVHEGEDDLGLGGDEESLRTGNSGARIACGVIGWGSGC